MQKIYFFNLSLLIIWATFSPILGMEEVLPDTTVKTFIVDLCVREKTPNDTDNSLINDKHACEVLGIEWSNDNKYKTHAAEIYNADNPYDKWAWDMTHPLFLPLATIANKAHFKELEYTVLFPNICPTHFVEELKNKKSITFKNTFFVTPVEITVHLKTVYENGQTTYYDNLHFDPISDEEPTSNISSPSPDELLKQFPQTPTEIQHNGSDSHNDNKTELPTPKLDQIKRVFLGGLTAVGIIALIIYLYKNNQQATPVSPFTNLMEQLTKYVKY